MMTTKAPSPAPPGSSGDGDDVTREEDTSPTPEEKEILDNKQEIEKKIEKKTKEEIEKEEKEKEKEKEEKGGKIIVPVDSQCPEASTSTVYCDAEGRPWDAMLNQTNVGPNNNKYYRLQLLEGSGTYFTWFNWGRIGYSNKTEGQTRLAPFTSIESAKDSFRKKFYDKTENQWPVDFENFVKYKGKYDVIKLDYTKKEPVESKLDPHVLSLIQLISDVKAMENAVMEMNYDVENFPLGKLSKEQILSGYEALTTIEEYIKAGKPNCIEAEDACSMFYTKIPHFFGFRTPPMITTLEQIKIKMDLLYTLQNIVDAVKAFNDVCKDTVNKTDSFYDNLKIEMKPLQKESDLFKMLSDYLHNTYGKTHADYTLEVEDIFELNKEGEDGRYKDLGNKQLLWHGSRLTNWGGIFSQGLRIAPPEAPVTGYRFGKGVYFADMASKSAYYCFTSPSAPTGILLLCEVSLGSERELLQSDFYANKLPAGKHSTKGLGKIAPAPAEDKFLGDVKVPMGCGADTGVTNPNGPTLPYNEYIVYDVAQIKMKYALRVKFTSTI